MTEPESVLRLPETVFMERMADEIVFLRLTDHSYYGLDPIAARMMELLLAESSVEAVVRALELEFDTTAETLFRDVAHLVDQLVDTGLAERAVRPGPPDLAANSPDPAAEPPDPLADPRARPGEPLNAPGEPPDPPADHLDSPADP